MRICYLVGMASSTQRSFTRWRARIGCALTLATMLSACSGDAATTDAGADDAACISDGDCVQSTCGADADAFAVDDLEPVALRCDEWTEGGEVGELCDANLDCARGLCALAGTCVAPCGDSAHCGGGQRCQPVFVRGEGEALHAVGACVARVSLPGDAVVTHELREGVLDAADTPLAPPTATTLALPGAIAPTLFALEHLAEDAWAGVTCRPPICVNELRSLSDGAVLFSLDDVQGGGPAPLNPVSATETSQPTTVYIGNGPDTPYSDLGYELSLATEVADDLHITSISRPMDGGTLDLNVYYVGDAGFAPEGARGNALLAAALDEVDTIFGAADITVGEVRQIVIGGALPARGVYHDNRDSPAAGFEMLSYFGMTWLEFPPLQRLSAGAANVAANVFLVRSIDAAQGLSGGIPGAMGMHGTGSSGIVIEADGMDDGVKLGRKIAHELAHFMGLFHTYDMADSGRQVWSPTTDIPEAEEADNLMSPLAEATGTTLSPQQAAILSQAPILR